MSHIVAMLVHYPDFIVLRLAAIQILVNELFQLVS